MYIPIISWVVLSVTTFRMLDYPHSALRACFRGISKLLKSLVSSTGSLSGCPELLHDSPEPVPEEGPMKVIGYVIARGTTTLPGARRLSPAPTTKPTTTERVDEIMTVQACPDSRLCWISEKCPISYDDWIAFFQEIFFVEKILDYNAGNETYKVKWQGYRYVYTLSFALWGKIMLPALHSLI